ncbi:hypothetical protein RQ832_05320 [Roseomonas sp. DSM 102946]|nr:hypothetical protein [Roseomonas sp. DSM 102946]
MHSYAVKVRDKTFIWGSKGVLVDLAWPLLLVIDNDPRGDPIKLGSESTTTTTDLGTLQPGECWTLPLVNLRGVHASCASDSVVACTILVPHRGTAGNP